MGRAGCSARLLAAVLPVAFEVSSSHWRSFSTLPAADFQNILAAILWPLGIDRLAFARVRLPMGWFAVARFPYPHILGLLDRAVNE